MTWDDRVSFLLTEGLQIKKIALLDAVMDGQSQDDGGFDADVAIATGELSRLIPDLIEALGGEGRTGLGDGLPASLQTPPAAETLPVRLAQGRGQGTVTGPATAPADTAPEEAPF